MGVVMSDITIENARYGFMVAKDSLVRMDRKTGKAWMMRNATLEWIEIREAGKESEEE